VAKTCRVFGISRARFYEWKGVADHYGPEALDPQGAPGVADAHRRRQEDPGRTQTEGHRCRSGRIPLLGPSSMRQGRGRSPVLVGV